jgi:hypothetical protein
MESNISAKYQSMTFHGPSTTELKNAQLQAQRQGGSNMKNAQLQELKNAQLQAGIEKRAAASRKARRVKYA